MWVPVFVEFIAEELDNIAWTSHRLSEMNEVNRRRFVDVVKSAVPQLFSLCKKTAMKSSFVAFFGRNIQGHFWM